MPRSGSSVASLTLVKEMLEPKTPPNSPSPVGVVEEEEESVEEPGMVHQYTVEEVGHLLHLLGRLAGRRWDYWSREVLTQEEDVTEETAIGKVASVLKPFEDVLLKVEKALTKQLHVTRKGRSSRRWLRGVKKVPALEDEKLGEVAARYSEDFHNYCTRQLVKMSKDVMKAYDD